jgi:hypothetical protein
VARWQFIVGDEGRQDADLTAAKQRRCTWRLRDSAFASFAIDGRHRQAAGITELVTDLQVLRDGVLVYRGRIGQTSDDVGTDAHTVQVASADYRAILDRRLLLDDLGPYTAADTGNIAWALVSDTQARDGGDLGITRGLHPTTAETTTRSYAAPRQTVAAAVTQLGETGTGFDWEVDAELELNLYPGGRGAANNVVLDYGGVVAAVRRDVNPAAYANAVLDIGDTALATEQREAADIATAPEGRWDAQFSAFDIKEQAALAEHADWLLEQSSTIQPAYTVRLKPGRWRGPAHIGLGDPCRLVIRSGRLDVDTTLRVFEITVALGQSGEEDVDLTLGAPLRTQPRSIQELSRRLEDLERR